MCSLQFLRAQVHADCENQTGEIAVIRLSELIRERLTCLSLSLLRNLQKDKLKGSQSSSPPASETSPTPESQEATKNEELKTMVLFRGPPPRFEP